MNRLSLSTLPALGAMTARWAGTESPKAFLLGLRDAPSYYHELIAEALTCAGFLVRSVRKRMHHHVWAVSISRGNVEAGAELGVARRSISGVLHRCGTEYPCGEVDVAVSGTRAVAAFIFDQGSPGTLVFVKGRKSWCADECG